MNSNPGQGTKIPHALWCRKKKKNFVCINIEDSTTCICQTRLHIPCAKGGNTHTHAQENQRDGSTRARTMSVWLLVESQCLVQWGQAQNRLLINISN